MKYWITTDTHFGHKNIIEYCGRPIGFEELIIENLKKVVAYDDVIIHLGDVAFRDHNSWVRRFCESIPGKKILCIGNHDRNSTSWYIDKGFCIACHELIIPIYGEKISFTHRESTSNNYTLNIHGHGHNNGPNGYYNKDHDHMALEHTNYMPLDLEKIVI